MSWVDLGCHTDTIIERSGGACNLRDVPRERVDMGVHGCGVLILRVDIERNPALLRWIGRADVIDNEDATIVDAEGLCDVEFERALESAH